MQPIKVLGQELRLGDTVRFSNMVWGLAIVEKIDAEEVKFFRPYGTTADFSYTGGVICYIGIEHFSIPREALSQPSAIFEVVERRELR